MFRWPRSIHFIGIGGSGMGSLAELALASGCTVSGSDLSENDVTRLLSGRGARVELGHRPENIAAARLVVYSGAVPRENVELVGARSRGIPCSSRGQVLARLLDDETGIAITGTHGKTTTTAMLSLVLEVSGMDPTVVLGGSSPHLDGGARLGSGRIVVVEADESDGSHLLTRPYHAILTSMDTDHLDYYGNLENLEASFVMFARHISPGGGLVYSADDRRVQELAGKTGREDIERVSYGLAEASDLRADSVKTSPGGSRFTVIERGSVIGEIELAVLGIHNVVNALAALAVARMLGAGFADCARALAAYRGAKRRFERRGEAGGVTVIDDYGHHPTEIERTLEAARLLSPKRITVLFQPHRYSRTERIGAEFGHAFDRADRVLITEIYAAGEEPRAGVSGALIRDTIRRAGHPDVDFVPELEEAVRLLAREVRSGDLVLTMGAGDVWQAGDRLLLELGRSPGSAGWNG